MCNHFQFILGNVSEAVYILVQLNQWLRKCSIVKSDIEIKLSILLGKSSSIICQSLRTICEYMNYIVQFCGLIIEVMIFIMPFLNLISSQAGISRFGSPHVHI